MLASLYPYFRFPRNLIFLVPLTMLLSGAVVSYHYILDDPWVNKEEATVSGSLSTPKDDGLGQVIVFISISGGGFRAAAFSYGVLDALSSLNVNGEHAQPGKNSIFENEIDIISGVSGGAITAAHLATNFQTPGNFQLLHTSFLKKDAELRIRTQALIYFWNWFPLIFTNYSLTNIAAQHYDSELFHSKTFKDLPLRPHLILNATDIAAKHRFEFTRDQFTCIGSSWRDFRIADAVAASAAYPGAFNPLLLKNFNKNHFACRKGEGYQNLGEAYADRIRYTYLHLADGGVADNTGLFALRSRLFALDGPFLRKLNAHCLKGVLLLVIDVSTKIGTRHGTRPHVGLADQLLTSVNMIHDRAEGKTLKDIRDLLIRYTSFFTPAESPVVKEVHIGLNDAAPFLRDSLSQIPTRLVLQDQELETLITTGRALAQTKGDDIQAFFREASSKTLRPCSPFNLSPSRKQ